MALYALIIGLCLNLVSREIKEYVPGRIGMSVHQKIVLYFCRIEKNKAGYRHPALNVSA
jgi:hypothetical protein